MRWEDERYVRLYTRNTSEWSSMSWQARGLFALIMREVDRAGILSVGRLGLKGVAVSVRATFAEIEGPLQELLQDGSVKFDEAQGVVYLPNFIEAQECIQSDKARKRASRERAMAKLSVSPEDVTPCDAAESQPVTESPALVTDGHGESQGVTLNQAVPSRAKPSRADGRPARATRGSRMQPGWKPSVATLQWAAGLGVRAEACVDEFVDHWLGVAGERGVKADWESTFRNRIRALIDSGRAPSGGGPVSREPMIEIQLGVRGRRDDAGVWHAIE